MREYSETIPVQYEEGKTLFMGSEILVDERVLIPRPETELLVDACFKFCSTRSLKEPFVLDIGTGSGVVSISLGRLLPEATIIASDISREALKVASKNVKKQELRDNIELVESDLFSYFKGGYEGLFNCIVSNPPYVSSQDYETLDAWVKAEPRIALYAGEKGMMYLERIIEGSRVFLAEGGLLAVEIGYDQKDLVLEEFKKKGFSSVTSFKDFNGIDRVITGLKNG